MTATKTGTYERFRQEPVRNLGRTGDPVAPGQKTLKLAGLGQFDLDPQLDFREHRVQPGIAGGGFQVGGGIAQPADGGGIEIAGEQPDLEIVEHVERALAARDRTPASLRRVFLDALKRKQRVDAGRGLRRGSARVSEAVATSSGSEKPVDLVRLALPAGVPIVVPFGP